MEISFADVAGRFEKLLSGELTRDEVDRWAWSMMQLRDVEELQFCPASDEDRIWRGLSYLFGIDMPGSPAGEFLLSDDDVRAAWPRIADGLAP